MSCCRNFVSYEYDNECNIVFTDAAGLQQAVSLKGGTAVLSSTGNEIVLTDIEGNQILIKEADSPITLIELQSAITDCHSSGPQPPTIFSIADITLTAGELLTINPFASGTAPITWSYSGITADTFDSNTGSLTFTTTSVGNLTINFNASNLYGSDNISVNVTVLAEAPVIAPIPSQSDLALGDTFSYTPSLIEGTQPITWFYDLGLGGNLGADSFDPATGALTYTPATDGPVTIIWVASNTNLAGGGQDTQQTIVNVWEQPVISLPANSPDTVIGQQVTIAPTVVSGTEPLTWSLIQILPSVTPDSFNTSTGELVFTPVVETQYTISIQGSNFAGSDIAITAVDAGFVPVVDNISDQSVTAGSVVNVTPVASAGTTPINWTYQITPTATADSFNTTTGEFTYTPPSAGTYSVELFANNDFGTGSTTFDILASDPAGVVVMDAAWRSANGGATGPWTMDQEFTTYRLEEDVTADRTAFIIGADNITMDITDSTINYNNVTPTNFTNPEFDNGSTGWVLPTLPGGEVATIKTDAVYNQRECQTGTTSLELPPLFNDDNVNGISEYTFSTADSYTFQANEIYGITFWSNVWSIGSTGNRCRVSASINGVSLLGDDGNGDPNPFSVNKPGTQHNGIVQLGTTLTGQIDFRVYKYTTNTPDDPVTCYFDNFLISYAGCHGVCNKSSNLSESAQAGGAINNVDNFTFNSANGSVIQSVNPTLGGSCIFTKTVNGNSINGDVVLRTHPEDVLNISGRCITADYCTDLTVAESVVTDNRALRVTHRENLYGFSIHATAIKGTSNISTTAVSGCQGAITARPDGDPNASVTISGNGQQQTRFTNGFFINMYTDDGATGNFIVENVNVNNGVPASGNGGRGIHWDGANGNTGLCTIRDCVVVTQEQPLSQEYGINNDGYVLNGCYGIQVEGLSDSLIIDNCDITVQGNYVMSGYRCNCNNLGDQLNSEMQNSTVRVLSSDPTTWLTGSSRASVILFAKIDGTLLGVQTNNTFIFNDCLVNMDNSCQNDIVFEGTTLQYIDAGTPQTNPYNVGYNGGGQYVFRNSSFADQGTKDWLTVDTQVAFAGGGTPSPVSYVRYVEDCDITLTDENGTPLTNFPAVITDNEGNVVFNGNTDANGKITQEFMWFEALLDGVNRTTTNNYGNPFTITTGYNGGTATHWILDETTRNEIIDVTTPIPLAPPVVAAIPDANITDGDTYNVTPTLVSGDQPITWSYTIDGSPTGADSFNTSTGEFTFTPSSPATYNVVITASNSGGVDSVPFSITSVPLPSRPAYFYSGFLQGTSGNWVTPVITTNPGDILVSVCVGRNMEYFEPGDWTSEASASGLSVGSQGGGRARVASKLSTGESTSYTFTPVAATTNGCKLAIFIIPGATGFNMGTIDDNNGNAAGETISPAITTTTANEVVMRVCWNARNNGDPTFPAGWENLFDGTANPAGDPTGGYDNPDGVNLTSLQVGYQVQPTAGTNGPVTVNYLPSFRPSMQNITFSIQQ